MINATRWKRQKYSDADRKRPHGARPNQHDRVVGKLRARLRCDAHVPNGFRAHGAPYTLPRRVQFQQTCDVRIPVYTRAQTPLSGRLKTHKARRGLFHRRRLMRLVRVFGFFSLAFLFFPTGGLGTLCHLLN